MPTAAPMSEPHSRDAGTPDTIISENHTPLIKMVWPKSGCDMSNMHTKPVTTIVMIRAGSVGSFNRHDNIHAIAIAKKGFRNSDG